MSTKRQLCSFYHLTAQSVAPSNTWKRISLTSGWYTIVSNLRVIELFDIHQQTVKLMSRLGFLSMITLFRCITQQGWEMSYHWMQVCISMEGIVMVAQKLKLLTKNYQRKPSLPLNMPSISPQYDILSISNLSKWLLLWCRQCIHQWWLDLIYKLKKGQINDIKLSVH